MFDYGKLTQGSIINNLRDSKFPKDKFCGIVITARCDIANCKVDRFYYLFAAPVGTWVQTYGLKAASEALLQKEMQNALEIWKDSIPDYDNLIHSSIYKVTQFIENAKPQQEMKAETFEKERSNILEKLCSIKNLSYDVVRQMGFSQYEQKFPIYSKQIQKKIREDFYNIFSGKNTHYCFLPRSSYAVEEETGDKKDDETKYNGLIISLIDISYITYDVAEMIEKQHMDFKLLDDINKQKYNEQFYLQQSEDIVYPEYTLRSPYVEHLMQRFSQAFIRIGIDVPPSEEFKKHWDKKLFDEESRNEIRLI